jgi:hypothetical protein
MVKRTIDNAELANKSIRELLASIDDSRRFCAYFVGPNRLLADNEMLAKEIWRLHEPHSEARSQGSRS